MKISIISSKLHCKFNSFTTKLQDKMECLLWFIFSTSIVFTVKADCDAQSDKGVQNEVVEIQFLKKKCSISCHIDKDKANTIYFMKLLMQINSTFYDVLHIRRIGERNKTTWFNCTNMRSRSSHEGSNIDEAILVFKLDSDYLLDTDNSVYKCEIDSESYTETQWNTANIDWTGCNDEHSESESICTKSSLLFTLVVFLCVIVL